jgi:hypothetical protein
VRSAETPCRVWVAAVALVAAPLLLAGMACGGRGGGHGVAPTTAPAPAPAAAPHQSTAAAVAQTPSGRRNPPADHTKDRKGARHKSGSKDAAKACVACHGADLRGGTAPSCFTCHDKKWR